METKLSDGTIATLMGGLVALGAGIKWFLDYVLRAVSVRSGAREQDAKTDLLVSGEVLEYSKDLRADMKQLRAEVVELRKENKQLRSELEEFRQYVKDMYDQNIVLKRQNDEFQKHLNECSLAINKLQKAV